MILKSIVFFITIAFVLALISLVLLTRKTVFNKLPKGCQKVVNKIMGMLLYNSILRFVI